MNDYDLTKGTVEEKKARALRIQAKIDRENARHTNSGSGGKGIFAIILIAIVLSIFALNAKASDEYIFVDTTHDGHAIFEKAPDYDSLQAHYLRVVSKSMEELQSDTLNQDGLLYNVYNVAMQCIFANRLPDRVRITPYNMICLYTDDPILRYKLINLVSNTVWLRPKNATIIMSDNRRFSLNDGQWYYIASEAEIRPVSYDEVVCLVMGVNYTPPKTIEKFSVEPEPVKECTPLGYVTVEP